jgi:hypothetical protein
MKNLLRTAAVMLIAVSLASAQSIQERLVVTQNDGHNGGLFKVDVQVQGTGLTGGPPIPNTIDGATIDVSYDPLILSFPTGAGGILGAITWNAGILDLAYSVKDVTNPSGTFVNILLGGGNVNKNTDGTPAGFDIINDTFTTVISLTFTIVDASQSATLSFPTGPNSIQFFTTHNNSDHSFSPQIPAFTFGNGNLTFNGITNQPLPIQLASFATTSVSQKSVTLAWATLSETNNYGFEVQRSASKTTGFATIPGSFTKGNGTTAVRHSYSYTDAAPSAAQPYYRLRQIDLNNAEHFSDVLQVTGVGSAPVIPTEFAMRQNYPNPFNPTTIIEFDLPKDSHVMLDLYNILGQKVMSILNEIRLAGTQRVQIDASRLATGVYLYRLAAGDKVFMKKMTLIK